MKRIWELDALRGISIIWVVILHLLYDLQSPVLLNPVVDILRRAVGIVFVMLSGLCVTLGKRNLRRGAVVFGCAMVITAVTALMAHWGMLPPAIIIRFGVLHLIGIAMLLWSVCKKLPTWALLAAGLILVAVGYAIADVYVQTPWLFPLGLHRRDFSSGDYFPLMPFLGWFFLGAVLGRTLYKYKQTRLPGFPLEAAPVRLFRWCGRNCLWIYLLHQPVIYLGFVLFS